MNYSNTQLLSPRNFVPPSGVYQNDPQCKSIHMSGYPPKLRKSHLCRPSKSLSSRCTDESAIPARNPPTQETPKSPLPRRLSQRGPADPSISSLSDARAGQLLLLHNVADNLVGDVVPQPVEALGVLAAVVDDDAGSADDLLGVAVGVDLAEAGPLAWGKNALMNKLHGETIFQMFMIRLCFYRPCHHRPHATLCYFNSTSLPLTTLPDTAVLATLSSDTAILPSHPPILPSFLLSGTS